MNTQHTPGPWNFKNRDGKLVFGAFNGTREKWIASKEISVTNKDEDIANARLIAAAPDLLESLIELTSPIFIEALGIGFAAIITKNRKSQYRGHSFEDKSQVIKKAKQAIYKATQS